MQTRILGFLIALITTTVMIGCGDTNPSNQNAGPTEAAGDVYYGGVFRMNETGDVRSLFP